MRVVIERMERGRNGTDRSHGTTKDERIVSQQRDMDELGLYAAICSRKVN